MIPSGVAPGWMPMVPGTVVVLWVPVGPVPPVPEVWANAMPTDIRYAGCAAIDQWRSVLIVSGWLISLIRLDHRIPRLDHRITWFDDRVAGLDDNRRRRSPPWSGIPPSAVKVAMRPIPVGK